MKKSFNFTKKDLILLIIMGITVLIVDYSLRWYKVYKEHNLGTAIISKYVVEVIPEELENYIEENHNTFVYMCVNDEQICRTFEKRFSNTIKEDNLGDYIIYINLKDIEIDTIISKFATEELKKEFIEKDSIPVILVFVNDEIVDYINYNNSNMRESEIIRLFEEYGIIVDHD